ncbi:MAG: hypothetical protein HZA48_05915 [Planctomycetes bacterium]|nr:hypothetical protein [Planctomycetota bacterium]
MVHDEKILKHANLLLRRKKISVFLDWLMEILFFMVYGSALIFVIDRIIAIAFTGTPFWHISNYAVIAIEGALLLASIAVAAIMTRNYLRQKTDPMVRIAKTADNALGLQDRFSSVTEFILKERTGAFEELAKEDAGNAIDELDTRMIIDMPKPNYRWGILLGYLTIVSVGYFTPAEPDPKKPAGLPGHTHEIIAPEEETLITLDVPLTVYKQGGPELFGNPDRAEGANKVPKIVDPLIGEGPVQTKEVDVYNDEQADGVSPPNIPLKQIITKYRKLAEDTIAQEKYPQEDKQLLLKYFDRLK